MGNKRGKLYQIILTSGVIASLIAGISSVIVSIETNRKLEDLEEQKYTYDLHEKRYEELKSFLEYFSGFQVYDAEMIYRFDVNSEEYSLDAAADMMHNSINEFVSQLNQLSPYLSDEAINMMEDDGVFEEDAIEHHDLEITYYADTDLINTEVKRHMEQTNEEFDYVNTSIIKAITYDIHKAYVPE